MSIKMKIDSLEFDLPDTLAPFAKVVADKMDSIQKLTQENVSIKSELETKQGKIDGLEIELKNKESEIEKAKKAIPSDREMVKLAKGRLDVEDVARKVFGDDFQMDSLETIDIKKKIIEKASPETKLDGKSNDYVEGIFSAISKSSTSGQTSGVEDGLVGMVKDGTERNDSKDKVKLRYIDAYKKSA